jgi:hypothetical protein
LKPVEIALQSATDRVLALGREVDRLHAKKFPTEPARKLLLAIKHAVESVQKDLDEFVSEDAADWDDDGMCLQVQGFAAPVVHLHELLQHLDKVDSPRLPFEIISAFEKLMSELGVPSRLLLKPERKYNYSTRLISQLVARIEGMPAEILSRELPDLVVIGFPSAEADSTLLHTLLFHEVGHVIYRGRLGSHVAPIVKNRIEHKGAQDKKAAATTAAWTEEVCCDLVALRLVGPAYWLAFEWYSVALLERASASQSHPDLALRNAVMSAYHKKLCDEFVDAHAIAEMFGLGTELRSMHRGRATSLGTSEQFASETLQDVNYRSELFAVVDTHINSPFRLEGIADHIQNSARELKRFVPPASLLKPAQFAALTYAQLLAIIFCAVWHFRVQDFAPWKNSGVTDKGRVLSELTLAAVEAATLVRDFQ